MKNRILILFLSILLMGSLSGQAQAAWIWTPQSRRWVNPKYAAKDSPRAQMDWAVNFFEKGDYAASAREFRKLVQVFPRSELAPEAQFLVGISYELMEKPAEAFVAYKKVVEIYPFSSRFKDSIEREFAIAESFSAGKRLKLIGPISFPSLDKAIEIYQHIVDQAPYGEYGAKAQLRLGESYRKQQRYEEASRAFQRVVSDFPSSPFVADAKYNIAFCAYHLSLKPSYDQSATDEAINWFNDFIASHPTSDLIPEARESLRKLQGYKVQGLVQVASFYEKQGKRASAIVYYKQIVQDYPDSPEAAKALSKLTEFEQAGLKK